MRKTDPAPDPIEHELRGEAANSLGIADRRLREAMQKIVAFDAAHPEVTASDPARFKLLCAASDVLWSYIIQKEMIGAADHDLVTETFGVTREVWRLMGVIHPDARP